MASTTKTAAPSQPEAAASHTLLNIQIGHRYEVRNTIGGLFTVKVLSAEADGFSAQIEAKGSDFDGKVYTFGADRFLRVAPPKMREVYMGGGYCLVPDTRREA